MIGHSRTRRLADVHSQIESVRLVNFPKNCLASLGERHQFAGRLGRRGIEIRSMLIRYDKKMTADVGIDIKDDVIVLRAVKDEGRVVIARVAQRAEDAG